MTLASHAAALLTSPILLLWILFYARGEVDERLYLYMRLALPKPSNPDLDSMEAAIVEGYNTNDILGLGKYDVKQQIRDDVNSVHMKLQAFAELFTRFLPWRYIRWKSTSAEASIETGPGPDVGHPSDSNRQLSALDTHMLESAGVIEPGQNPQFLRMDLLDSDDDGEASAALTQAEDKSSSTQSPRSRRVFFDEYLHFFLNK